VGVGECVWGCVCAWVGGWVRTWGKDTGQKREGGWEVGEGGVGEHSGVVGVGA
jgi:hypothetical protein